MRDRGEFGQLVAALCTRYGGGAQGQKQRLAREIGVLPSVVSRMLAGRAPDVEVCLRLAQATKTSASKILRAAGKGKIADLLEDLYGAAAERRLGTDALQITPLEEQLLVHLRSLKATERKALLLIVDTIFEARIDPPAREHPKLRRTQKTA